MLYERIDLSSINYSMESSLVEAKRRICQLEGEMDIALTEQDRLWNLLIDNGVDPEGGEEGETT